MTTQRHTIGAPQGQGGQFRAHQRAEADDNMLGGPATDLAAAQDPATPLTTLLTLSYSKFDDVRAAVAGNPSTPLRDLRRMLGGSTQVADAVRGNTTFVDGPTKERPRSTRDALTIAQDPTTSGDFLDKLAVSRSSEVRSAVASNPQTLPKTLLKFAGPESFYRIQALSNPSFPADEALRIASSNAGGDHLALLRNLSLPLETINAIVRRGPMAHAQAAAHPNASIGAINHMADGDNTSVLAIIARNRRAPAETREYAAARRVRLIEDQALARDIAAGTETARRELAAEAARIERNRVARERRAAERRELVSA